ncbi:MAG: YkgJ family cysteine cluster protein, partial [Gammaproteobacteria bacterium]
RANEPAFLDAVDVTGHPDVPAGRFASWLREILETLETQDGIDVPCGNCTACCRASQFIHIASEERETLAHIPKALLFPAPGRPKGDLLMGYDENGCCPMLVDERCSIYAYRPRTCRNYDCRIFAATRIAPAPEQAVVAERATRWRFDFSEENARNRGAATRRAAKFLVEHAGELREVVPRNPTGLAVLAIRAHALFVDGAGASPKRLRDAVIAIAKRSNDGAR